MKKVIIVLLAVFALFGLVYESVRTPATESTEATMVIPATEAIEATPARAIHPQQGVECNTLIVRVYIDARWAFDFKTPNDGRLLLPLGGGLISKARENGYKIKGFTQDGGGIFYLYQSDAPVFVYLDDQVLMLEPWAILDWDTVWVPKKAFEQETGIEIPTLPTRVVNGVLYVPVRRMCELLGWEVSWQEGEVWLLRKKSASL